MKTRFSTPLSDSWFWLFWLIDKHKRLNEKCWHWPIFPARLRASIFGLAQLNFCVRNGYRWTLCSNNTNFFIYSLVVLPLRVWGWHWPIFPVRRRTSIFGSAQLNFCVRNGYRWTLCVKNTNQLVAGDKHRVHLCLLFISTSNTLLITFKITGAPPGTRTPDPLIKSQLLYQLS